jgi:cystathionine beta-lyase
MTRPEGTYLVWLDFTRLGMEEKEVSDFLTKEAGVALTPGSFFGPGGTGYHRMNVACPRATLQRALDQLSSAYQELAHG